MKYAVTLLDYLRLVIQEPLINLLDWEHVKDNLYVRVPSGYTIKQCLHWHWPIITRRVNSSVTYEKAVYDRHYYGDVYQLFEDANDVAGLSEEFAKRTVSTV